MKLGRRGQAQRARHPARPFGQRVTVHGGRSTGGRAGDVEQDRRVGPTVDGAHIGPEQGDQRIVERDLVA